MSFASDRLPPHLGDSALWQQIFTASLSFPLPDQEIVMNTAICAVTVECLQARPTWNRAGWARMVAAVGGELAIVATRSLWLRTQNLLIFPKVDDAWILRLSFPDWLPTVNIVVQEFSGGSLLVNSSVVYSTEPVSLAMSNPIRRELTLRNASDRALYVGLGATVSLTDYFAVLPPGAVFGFPESWQGEISGLWELGGSGEAIIKEFL